MRFYGFAHDEIVGFGSGMLALHIDPKLAWALAHRERFPIDLNRAPRELLLRVPGLGVRSVDRLLQARRVRCLHAEDLERLNVPLKKVLPFVTLPGLPTNAAAAMAALDAALRGPRERPPPQQASLFEVEAGVG